MTDDKFRYGTLGYINKPINNSLKIEEDFIDVEFEEIDDLKIIEEQ